METSAPNDESRESPKSDPHSRGDVFVVDDLVDNLKLIDQLLARNGYHVRAVRSGAAALVAVRSRPPDLILLDVRMPDMDGYETCQRLKSDPATAAIPVIFLSALRDVDDRVKGFEAGGVDFVSKPFEEAELLARVSAHVSLVRLRESLAARVEELAAANEKLGEALRNVKRLSGLLPICCHCKKIRDDKGYWNRLEKYLDEHTDAMLSHGICPECLAIHYAEEEDG